MAYQSNTNPAMDKTNYQVLIAGLRLQDNDLTEAFKQRLHRAVQLPDKPGIIVMGGMTGDSSLSEAQVGAQYLLYCGVDEHRIVKEEASRHTLENMQFARELLKPGDNETVAVISSRYHLYRLVVLAKSVGIEAIPIAAEDRLVFSRFNFMRMIKEAYYLHWFFSGKLWRYFNIN